MNLKKALPALDLNLPSERNVLWKNVCTIGDASKECLVEMSRTKTKFWIVALDLEKDKYHHICMWRAQAKNVLKACGNKMSVLMTFLDFKFGVL